MTIDPRQHSTEHILTAAFGELFGAKIIDSRFKGTKVRCDFEIESDEPLEEIIAKAETRSNEIISENHKVTDEEVSLEEARERCPLHRLPDGLEKVQIVKIGEGVLTPCRGEHVNNSSAIGALKIRTFNYVEPHKLRLTFVVE